LPKARVHVTHLPMEKITTATIYFVLGPVVLSPVAPADGSPTAAAMAPW
jgi:hypothetical protein